MSEIKKQFEAITMDSLGLTPMDELSKPEVVGFETLGISEVYDVPQEMRDASAVYKMIESPVAVWASELFSQATAITAGTFSKGFAYAPVLTATRYLTRGLYTAFNNDDSIKNVISNYYGGIKTVEDNPFASGWLFSQGFMDDIPAAAKLRHSNPLMGQARDIEIGEMLGARGKSFEPNALLYNLGNAAYNLPLAIGAAQIVKMPLVSTELVGTSVASVAEAAAANATSRAVTYGAKMALANVTSSMSMSLDKYRDGLSSGLEETDALNMALANGLFNSIVSGFTGFGTGYVGQTFLSKILPSTGNISFWKKALGVATDTIVNSSDNAVSIGADTYFSQQQVTKLSDMYEVTEDNLSKALRVPDSVFGSAVAGAAFGTTLSLGLRGIGAKNLITDDAATFRKYMLGFDAVAEDATLEKARRDNLTKDWDEVINGTPEEKAIQEAKKAKAKEEQKAYNEMIETDARLRVEARNKRLMQIAAQRKEAYDKEHFMDDILDEISGTEKQPTIREYDDPELFREDIVTGSSEYVLPTAIEKYSASDDEEFNTLRSLGDTTLKKERAKEMVKSLLTYGTPDSFKKDSSLVFDTVINGIERGGIDNIDETSLLSSHTFYDKAMSVLGLEEFSKLTIAKSSGGAFESSGSIAYLRNKYSDDFELGEAFESVIKETTLKNGAGRRLVKALLSPAFVKENPLYNTKEPFFSGMVTEVELRPSVASKLGANKIERRYVDVEKAIEEFYTIKETGANAEIVPTIGGLPLYGSVLRTFDDSFDSAGLNSLSLDYINVLSETLVKAIRGKEPADVNSLNVNYRTFYEPIRRDPLDDVRYKEFAEGKDSTFKGLTEAENALYRMTKMLVESGSKSPTFTSKTLRLDNEWLPAEVTSKFLELINKQLEKNPKKATLMDTLEEIKSAINNKESEEILEGLNVKEGEDEFNGL